MTHAEATPAEQKRQHERGVAIHPLPPASPRLQVFLDVVESVNLLVSAAGNVVLSEVVGVLKMRAYLSGMPECKLGLNDKVRSRGREGSQGLPGLVRRAGVEAWRTARIRSLAQPTGRMARGQRTAADSSRGRGFERPRKGGPGSAPCATT